MHAQAEKPNSSKCLHALKGLAQRQACAAEVTCRERRTMLARLAGGIVTQVAGRVRASSYTLAVAPGF